jgi:class 3 adenylate cyclase
LAKIVDEMDGFVVDYPGDGIMAHWELDTESDKSTLYSCIEACSYMDDAVKTIINPLLIQYGVPPIVCGIGASVGNVIVTKLGIPSFVTAKAIGNSINRAAKLASANLNSGVILIDKTILDRAYTVVPSDHPGPSAFKFLQTQEQTIEISPNIKLERTPLANNLLEYLNRLGVK